MFHLHSCILHSFIFRWSFHAFFFVSVILAFRMLDAKFLYGYEFLSCNFPIILTPLTERCFLSLTQALTYNYGGSLIGPTSTGKTQTIKGFSHILGRFLVSLSCLEDFEPSSIGRIFTGIAQEASWCLFDEFQQASNRTISVITFYTQHILNAIKSKQATCHLLDSYQVFYFFSFSCLEYSWILNLNASC